MAQFKKAKRQRFFGSLFAAGLLAGSTGLSLAFRGFGSGGGGGGSGGGLHSDASGFAPFAAGGRVFGPSSPRDRIPAMLTGGEFVVRKEAADVLGAPFLNRLNRGRVPRFQSGGAVTSTPVSQSFSQSNWLSFYILLLVNS